MTAPIRRPASNEAVMLWILHRFAEEFTRHAIIKGGMALRLAGCPRSTTDIDYVFVPYASKKEIAADIRRLLSELEGAEVEVRTHSKAVRATIALDQARVQVEASVAMECPADAASTGDMASALGEPARVVRVVRGSYALAQKLAAWNERRLYRDLFDVYYLRTRLGVELDRPALEKRLTRVETRRGKPQRRAMELEHFARDLRTAAQELDQEALLAELQPILPGSELAGLAPRIRAALIGLAETLLNE